MKAKLLGDHGERTYAVVFDKGEEAAAGLLAFARDHEVFAAQVTAIGGFSDMVLGYFAGREKQYQKIPIHEQVEVLSLIGDIALHGGAPLVHAHVVVGKADGTAWGGHLLEAHVWPTLEVIVVEPPAYLRRELDEETGLPLIRL
ncbi:MAG TPA: PPC domain-containing DNA-binding protein [Chloroflexota bacterium]|nr:PPC domain-containing DNA-binding protein [Chloroflexota bacterium]